MIFCSSPLQYGLLVPSLPLKVFISDLKSNQIIESIKKTHKKHN